MDNALILEASVIVQPGIFKEPTGATDSASQGSSTVPTVNSTAVKAEVFTYSFITLPVKEAQ